MQLALLVARARRARPRHAAAGARPRLRGAGGRLRDRHGHAGGGERSSIDGATWGRLAAAGIDGERALRRCDAGAALAAIGATVVSGPTGTNHADLVIVARA
ncbi:MAG: hypothetical protein HS111_27660 [Kofleriaceae bacterium]|nr:hypothetical protein [Kofleriaceae bacterium]